MTDTLSQLLQAPSRHPSLCGSLTYLTGDTVTFSGSQALSCTVSEGAPSGCLLGGAFSAACSLTLNDQDGAFTFGRDPYGAQVQVKLKLEGQETPLCVFTVSRVVRRERDFRLTLSGSDALGTAFEAAFTDDFSYPLTLGQLISRLAALAGFSWTGEVPNGGVVISQRPDWGDISLRQAVAFAACAAGSFACIARDGALRIKPVRPADDPFLLPPNVTLQREYGDAHFGPLKGLIVACTDAPRGAAPLTLKTDDVPLYAHNALSVSGNPLFPFQGAHTQALAQGLLSALAGLALAQAKVSWRGDPTLCLGDPVRIIDPAGRAVDTLITRQALAFSQGFSMQSDCSPPVALPAVGRIFTASGGLNAARLSGFFSGALIREGTLSAQALIAGSVTADHLAAGSVTASKIAANAIEAGHLSASALTAIDAEISTANIGYAQIKDASIQSLIARDAVTDRYYIDKLAVRNAQMVQATVGELVIKAADNKYYRLDVAANGSVTPTEVTLTSSEIAAGVTSDGHGAIIETDLTVADLSASNMKAVSALIDKLTASRIDVAELFARSATISQLQAVDISGNTSLHLYVQDNTNKTYAQMTDPAAGNAIHDGDIWIQSDGLRTWGDLSALTWGEAAAYKWGDFTAAKQYVRKGGAWALTDDPGSKYTVRSGIDILPLGIEIGGSKYIRMLSGADFQIKAGGTFTVDSGNFSIDANGNVTIAGTVSAADGQIADWAILPGRLKSGDGAGYVALDSDPTHTYAIWAGAEAADTAPFRVARDGTVYAAKIVTETETGGSTQVDLTQFPLWKLWYNVVKSYTSNSITLSNGDTINFNTAAATTLTGSWSGLTFTVEAKDAQNATVATKQETLTRSITPNQSGSTLSLFDSTHKMILSVGATSQSVGPLWTWTVDASGEYASGVSDGYASGLTAGKNAVAINKGSWSAGRISFTKSEGTPSTEAVALAAGAASWSGNTASVIIYDVQGGGSLNTGITVTVDASARYDIGWNDCLDNCTGYTCYTGTIRQLYDPALDVYVLAVTNYSTWTLYALPNRK